MSRGREKVTNGPQNSIWPTRQPSAAQTPSRRHHLTHKFASRLAPTKEGFCLCRSLPASESCPTSVIASRTNSPAGWLLQKRGFVFVGACLQANRALPQSLPHAQIRQQAGSYRGQDCVFCVGDKPASESCRATVITSRKNSTGGSEHLRLTRPQTPPGAKPAAPRPGAPGHGFARPAQCPRFAALAG
jgi:hypothetical protein